MGKFRVLYSHNSEKNFIKNLLQDFLKADDDAEEEDDDDDEDETFDADGGSDEGSADDDGSGQTLFAFETIIKLF